jgi:predicted RNase H-like HicB family nuclease
MRYAVVIEQAENNLGAYVPDLPGCVATGDTMEELMENLRIAIQWHIEALQETGQPVPKPSTQVSFVEAEIQAA